MTLNFGLSKHKIALSWQICAHTDYQNSSILGNSANLTVNDRL